VAAEDTSYDPDVWRSRREKSPLTGHCGAASYVVQALFGGEILSGSVDGERHLWNRIPGFRDIDLTSCQFGGDGLTPVAAGRVKLPT
ncbi:hypothetical protein ACE4Z7_24935, partial [Salmonella enterica]|uniref:YunG family protein n=1 Tax=Salmonella enterica TaxID=28901 RepID=UPI003D2E9353